MAFGKAPEQKLPKPVVPTEIVQSAPESDQTKSFPLLAQYIDLGQGKDKGNESNINAIRNKMESHKNAAYEAVSENAHSNPNYLSDSKYKLEQRISYLITQSLAQYGYKISIESQIVNHQSGPVFSYSDIVIKCTLNNGITQTLGQRGMESWKYANTTSGLAREIVNSIATGDNLIGTHDLSLVGGMDQIRKRPPSNTVCSFSPPNN